MSPQHSALASHHSALVSMIDLHAHILPGCDDGARDWNESLRMCVMALKDGIDTIVATPHTLKGIYTNDGPKIKEACVHLNERLKERQIKVTVLPGADVGIDPAIAEHISNGGALTINDNKRYIMLEFPDYFVLPPVKRLISRLKEEGITAIISHPERVPQFQREPDSLKEFVEDGILCQVTAMSITGSFGRTVRKFAEKLLSRNLVHVIATDCHSSTARPPILSDAVGIVSRLIGKEKAHMMVDPIPRAIIEGKDIRTVVGGT